MLANDFNTQTQTNYAFKPYGNLDAKQYPVNEQEMQAAYEELKYMYKIDAPSKSIAFIRVDIAPSQSDLQASKALAQKARTELAAKGELGKDTKKAGVATARHQLRGTDIQNATVKNFVATAPQNSLLIVSNDINGFEIIRMGQRTEAVDSIMINLVATAGGANLPQRVLSALNAGVPLDSLARLQRRLGDCGSERILGADVRPQRPHTSSGRRHARLAQQPPRPLRHSAV